MLTRIKKKMKAKKAVYILFTLREVLVYVFLIFYVVLNWRSIVRNTRIVVLRIRKVVRLEAARNKVNATEALSWNYFNHTQLLSIKNETECLQENDYKFVDPHEQYDPVFELFPSKVSVHQLNMSLEELDYVGRRVVMEYNRVAMNITKTTHVEDIVPTALRNARCRKAGVGCLNNYFFSHQKQPEGRNWISSLRRAPQFRKLFTSVEDIVFQNRLSLGLPLFNRWSLKMSLLFWFSIHHDGIQHDEHVHQGAGVAGTIYLQTNNEPGRIHFKDPRYPLVYDRKARNSSRSIEQFLFKKEGGKRSVWVEPKPGLLLLFPPWLIHKVEPTTAPLMDSIQLVRQKRTKIKNRVALSFNFGWNWRDGLDNSLLNWRRCKTKDMVDAQKIGIYGHNTRRELFEPDLQYISADPTKEQILKSYLHDKGSSKGKFTTKKWPEEFEARVNKTIQESVSMTH